MGGALLRPHQNEQTKGSEVWKGGERSRGTLLSSFLPSSTFVREGHRTTPLRLSWDHGSTRTWQGGTGLKAKSSRDRQGAIASPSPVDPSSGRSAGRKLTSTTAQQQGTLASDPPRSELDGASERAQGARRSCHHQRRFHKAGQEHRG